MITDSGPALPRPRLIAACLALAMLALVPFSAVAQETDEVVARVDGVEVRVSDLAIAEEDIGSHMTSIPPEGRRDYLINYLTDMILLAKAAEQRRLGEGDEFKRRLAYAGNKLLMETLLQAEGKVALTEPALRQVYDEATKQMAGEQEVHARHILVETEAEAKDVLVELKKGRDFAKLAQERSKDPGAVEGGDLGYFTRDQMVPEFADVAFKLEKGQLSDPVKTAFGWHIIRVEDKRVREVPSFESVREQIVAYVVRRSQAEIIGKLRAAAKIERVDQKP